MKILLVIWLSALMALGINHIDSNAWLRAQSPFVAIFASHLEAINAKPYIYGETSVTSVGEFKASDIAYFSIKLRFRVDATDGYPNLFQTAPINQGVRLEISGTTASIVVNDSSAPNAIKGLIITENLRKDQWYDLEVEALNGSFVKANLDGLDVADYRSSSLSVYTSQILVGQGFDSSRYFQGRIENVSIKIGSFPGAKILYAFYFIALAGLLVFLAQLYTVKDQIIPVSFKVIKYFRHVDWSSYIHLALAFVFCITLITTYFFPIYPDEVQIRFWLSRLPYDYPYKISGAPTCVATFFQSIPATMYLPGLINWLIHGWITDPPALRKVGLLVAFLWVSCLAFYLKLKVKQELVQNESHVLSFSQDLRILGFVISVFSIGVFPVFLVINRGEQLIFPSVILLISIFIWNQSLGQKYALKKLLGLVFLFFVAVSLILYGHPKGLFLAPFFFVVGWQLFRRFESRLIFLFAALLLVLHVIQNFIAFKYAFQCDETPAFQNMLKSFSIDPGLLIHDPGQFFDMAFRSLSMFSKYLHQLGFQEKTDVDYLPSLPLTVTENGINIFIWLNVSLVFFTLFFLIPYQYWKDISSRRFLTVNFVLLVIFWCVLMGGVFNLPKNWYDAGYVYSLLLIILIFFLGENFSGIFLKFRMSMVVVYLGLVALFSQAMFISRYLSEFMDGYVGPGVSIAKYDTAKARADLILASQVCNIDPVQGKKILVDDNSYFFFQKSKWPMAITYVWIGNDDKSIRQFFSTVDSDGLVANCSSIISPYSGLVKKAGDMCCISKSDLKNFYLIP
ncbi:hypothetical protein JWZ98_14460 [Methylomonas sp. EFPC1]|uniref:4-amino-4-deoxy-L-arabinose transferase-like glycosyltransferase n=1 Tax=Methylomonas defluvii TaxID=3045149 RepID=A0ABU4UFX3_9GAMM|nr:MULTISPECIES: hypothetical protein [unclassified Methylomonas]MDX8128374.1 hypothetical protein [Methylomonas sp. OY6]QSA99883.1 hypothetical protein JWZ98_14460 [Methylomonas sp. EFPC1]